MTFNQGTIENFSLQISGLVVSHYTWCWLELILLKTQVIQKISERPLLWVTPSQKEYPPWDKMQTITYCFTSSFWLQKILGVQYSIPDNIQISVECQHLLSRIFVANPAEVNYFDSRINTILDTSAWLFEFFNSIFCFLICNSNALIYCWSH